MDVRASTTHIPHLRDWLFNDLGLLFECSSQEKQRDNDWLPFDDFSARGSFLWYFFDLWGVNYSGIMGTIDVCFAFYLTATKTISWIHSIVIFRVLQTIMRDTTCSCASLVLIVNFEMDFLWWILIWCGVEKRESVPTFNCLSLTVNIEIMTESIRWIANFMAQ